ncbi:glycosyltransferase family 9 protein [Azotosporobacter soli]|uniref:glycosyltransferase family 9 protein n=1 Tax=Azotosporobacter soli TaxID=3055040 RepID=UPI0031FEFEDB
MRENANILISCTVNLGDVVLATAAVALLKEQYPTAGITMLVKDSVAPILEDHPLLKEVLVLPNRPKERSLKKLWQFVKEIRKRRFDMAILLDRKLRPALLAWLAGIPVRVGADRLFDNKPSSIRHLYTDVVKVPDDFLKTHQAELFQSVIRGYFHCEGSARPSIGKLSEAHRERAQALLPARREGAFRIALCVKGTYYLKDWPQENWGELLAQLDAMIDADYVIVGAPADAAYAEQIADKAKRPLKNLCGQTNLKELAALIEAVDLFITIDTGAMHIAATQPTPVIGLFRCVSANRWRPCSDSGDVLTIRLPECPAVTTPEDCPMQYCVDQIAVESVVERVLARLR